ncbi:hypothetical protein ABZU42_22095, partial [Micromonospora profundi]
RSRPLARISTGLSSSLTSSVSSVVSAEVRAGPADGGARGADGGAGPAGGGARLAGPAAGTARVAGLAAFQATDPDTGTLPALVWGDVPDTVPDGTQLAVAVNGRVGAVVPVVPADPGGRRFAALLTDDRLFRAGANTLDLYQVMGDGTLRRLALS